MNFNVSIDLDNYLSDWFTENEFKEEFVKELKYKIIDNIIYNDDLAAVYSDEIKAIIQKNSDVIINRVITNVTEAILKKKSIVSELPKPSEIREVNKEYEEYFMGLIDKAIAKRFK